MVDPEPAAAVKEQRRTARSTRQPVDVRYMMCRPGDNARKAAYQYLDGTFDTAAIAAARC